MTNYTAKLEQDGYLIRDNLLPTDLYQKYHQAVIKSWEHGKGWKTKLKPDGSTKSFIRLEQNQIDEIQQLLNSYRSENTFRYLYHSLHEDNDEDGVISAILSDVVKYWTDVLRDLNVSSTKSNVSITNFTQGCFLDTHNDFSNGQNQYKVTLLLYFGCTNNTEGCLNFEYKNRRSEIQSLENRSVLFIPNKQTNHWIKKLNKPSSHRLAFSGWLL